MSTSTSGTGTGGRAADGGWRQPTGRAGARRQIDPATPPLGPLIAAVRRVRQAIERGPLAVPGAAAQAASAFPGDARDALDRALARAGGEYEEDEWGFDEEFALGLRPLLDFLYDQWWRVQATGLDNVPGSGRALLVANHAGILPWDGTMMSIAILRSQAARLPRFLVLAPLDPLADLGSVATVMRIVECTSPRCPGWERGSIGGGELRLGLESLR